MKVYPAPVLVSRHCLWCKKPFLARKADVKRGWGNFDSKSCKAHYQKAHGGRSPNQRVKTEKANAILDKALKQDESFAEYDRLCQQEDTPVITDQMLINKAYSLQEECMLKLSAKQDAWLEDLIYDDRGNKVVSPQLSPSARKFLTQVYNDDYTQADLEVF
jgi:hypothetical protein